MFVTTNDVNVWLTTINAKWEVRGNGIHFSLPDGRWFRAPGDLVQAANTIHDYLIKLAAIHPGG